MRIAGIDPGLAATAIAGPGSNDVIALLKTKPKDSLDYRLSEIEHFVSRSFAEWLFRPHLVVIEGPSLNSPGRLALVRQGEVRGVIRLACFRLLIPILEIPPASLKKHATGNGRAEKHEMLDAARWRAPAGLIVHNDDEADAWLLRAMGRQAYGLDPVVLDHERDALAALGLLPDPPEHERTQ